MRAKHFPLIATLIALIPSAGFAAHTILHVSTATLGPGSRLTFQNIQSDERGVGYDAIDVTGNSSFSDTSTIRLLFNSSYSPQDGTNFELFHFLGSVSGASPLFDVPALDPGLYWNTSGFFQTGTVSVTATPAPEPTSVALLGLGTLLVAARRRR